MKLVFSKNEQSEILVKNKSGNKKTDFSYIDLIQELIKTKELDDPELEGDFTDAEKESIRSMVTHINREVADFYSEEEEPG